MATAAVIVAAGKGLRAGGGLPKQYRDLRGVPVLARAITAFLSHSGISDVVAVIGAEDRDRFEALVRPHLAGQVLLAEGGATRAESVAAGLAALATRDIAEVLVHDGARPLVSADLISRIIQATRDHGAAAPALAVSDTLWRASDRVDAVVPRDRLFRTQTPQGFRYAALVAAHANAPAAATDDVAVARAAGLDVAVVPGDEDNIKITEAGDFARAARLLGGTMDVRTGNGFDVHAFEPGNHVTLCGIDIPHDRALKGHSDADVAMHALTDAIYGALSEGDIGRWFPPSDPQWKGAASHVFLSHAADRIHTRGFRLTHADVTIICEMPKIAPHADKMRQRLADILGIDVARISVKATTSERLGFTGRSEGIAAMATATLVSA
jgi:2-C-methyl-D-erythritol 4-phosphate cytidylyltransferase/2-C-methyl-D-erythritol 2,4-cyclodiphosphate synthase